MVLDRRGPYGKDHAGWGADNSWSDAAAAQTGMVPMTGVHIRRGSWTRLLRFQYGGVWAQAHGNPEEGEYSLEFDGTSEYITEVYLHTFFAQPGTAIQLLDGLMFRTNLGNEIGSVDMNNPGLVRAFPCPVGRYRLAYLEGTGANWYFATEVKLYW